MFCGRHFEFLIHARTRALLTAWSASARSGAKITEVWDSQISQRIRSLTENDKVTLSRLLAISVISVPDLALADSARVLKIQNGGYKTQAIRDKAKRMRGLPVPLHMPLGGDVLLAS